jgi:hypothetical protein
MPYTLRITFTGLCLFVPEPVGGAETGLMHVLFPVFTGDGHDGHDGHAGTHRHLPVLYFDTAHLRAGSPGPDGVLGQKPLRNLLIQLGTDAPAADLRLCPAIVNLKEVTGEQVNADQYRADIAGKVTTRVTLGLGRNTAVASGVCWDFAGTVRKIAHKARWTIGNLEPPLQLPVGNLHGTGARGLPPLYPLADADGNQFINLQVFHTPAVDLPPEPELPVPIGIGATPAHFAGLYDLYRTGVPTLLPTYRDPDLPCPPSDPGSVCAEIGELGGSPFNCMVAGSWP